MLRSLAPSVAILSACVFMSGLVAGDEEVVEILETYCFDCHDEASAKGDFNLERLLEKGGFDGTLMFENLLTDKMPPADKERPDAKEKEIVLKWLARQQAAKKEKSFRRVRRQRCLSAGVCLFRQLFLHLRRPETSLRKCGN